MLVDVLKIAFKYLDFLGICTNVVFSVKPKKTLVEKVKNFSTIWPSFLACVRLRGTVFCPQPFRITQPAPFLGLTEETHLCI